MKSGESVDPKEWELGLASASDVILNPHVYLLASHSYYPFKVYQMYYQANTVHLLSSETKLHLNNHKTILLIPFRKD